MDLKLFEDPNDALNFEPFPIIFSRASDAYEGNGGALATNQPAFIGNNKGEYGLRIEESYQNLLLEGQSLCNTIATDKFAKNGTGTVNTTLDNTNVFLKNSNSSIKVSVDASIGNQGISTQPAPFNTTEGLPYTAIGIVKAPENKPLLIQINERNSSGSSIGDYTYNFVGTGKWQIVYITRTFGTGAVKGSMKVLSGANDGIPYEFNVGALMAIQKPYPLSWIPGGQTKSGDLCYIPKQEVQKFLDLSKGCIEFQSVFSKTTLEAQTQNKHLIGMSSSDNKNTLYISRDMSGTNLTFSTRDENGNSGTHASVNISGITGINKPIITIMWREGYKAIYINGNLVGSSSNVYLPKDFNNFFIGLWVSSSLHGNNQYSNITFSDLRTEEDIIKRQKEAQANGYFKIDSKVKAFIPLVDNLKGYRRIS